MKIYLLTAEHFSVPGIITGAFVNEKDAIERAVWLTNTMLSDNGWQELASPVQWRHHIERLQDEHGAAHCYVEISEQDVIGSGDYDALKAFVESMASMTTPEDEIKQIVEEHGADELPYETWADEAPSDAEYFANMDSYERQEGEYEAFMSMVRQARELLRGKAA